jgi:hypothetical protein
MAWQPINTAPRDRPVRLARDNGCAWEYWVGVWDAEYRDYPWLVIDATGRNYLAKDRPDYWHELEALEPPYTIE